MPLESLLISLIVGGALLYFVRRSYRALRARDVAKSDATCGCGRGHGPERARLQN